MCRCSFLFCVQWDLWDKTCILIPGLEPRVGVLLNVFLGIQNIFQTRYSFLRQANRALLPLSLHTRPLAEVVLNVSRIERGTLKYDFTETDIVELLDSVIEEIKGQTEQKGLLLIWEKPSSGIPALRADSDKLRQVFINLIDNALKYTPKGKILLKIILSKII